MIGLKIEAAKSNFFDRQKVMDRTSKAERKVLSKAGAFVRQRAKTSIRYRERPSSPGSPPSVHRSVGRVHKKSGKVVNKKQLVSPLREFMFFSYDRSSRTVVIGPALLNGTAAGKGLKALEYGGPAVILGFGGKKRVVAIRARPFMRPAMQAELENFPTLFADQVK